MEPAELDPRVAECLQIAWDYCEQHRLLIRRMIRKTLFSWHLGHEHVDDVFSDLLFVLASAFAIFGELPLPWVLGVARNKAREYARRWRRPVRGIPAREVKNPEQQFLDAELHERLMGYIADKNDRDRRILYLNLLGLGPTETAELMGIQVTTVKALLHRFTVKCGKLEKELDEK